MKYIVPKEMAYALVKRHKRLMIVDETGGVIYLSAAELPAAGDQPR